MASTTSAGVGFSSSVSPEDAVERALADALARGSAPPRLALMYGTVTYDQAALVAALRRRLPGVPLIGCSSGGVSINGKAAEVPRCVGLAVLRSDTARARTASAEDIALDPRRSGVELARALGPSRGGPSTTLVWYDPLTGANIASLLDGLAEGGRPIVFGGGAGQPFGRRVQTFQYEGDRALSGGAVAVTIDGLATVFELTHGAVPTAIKHTITRATDNILEELDGQPALDVLRGHLGISAEESQSNTANWSLGVTPPAGKPYEGMFTRGAFRVDLEKKTLSLLAPIPTGTEVVLCIRTKEAVYDRALSMGERLGRALAGERPVLALSFECGARQPFLGSEMSTREVIHVQERIGAAIPWLGMYAWGEIAPIADRSEFHNHTFPLCVLCEA